MATRRLTPEGVEFVRRYSDFDVAADRDINLAARLRMEAIVRPTHDLAVPDRDKLALVACKRVLEFGRGFDDLLATISLGAPTTPKRTVSGSLS